MSEQITAEDYSTVSDFLARYFRCVDRNKPEEWVALWTEDGTLALSGLEPFVGYERLMIIPRISFEQSEGKMCHMFSNLSCDYADDRDTVIAEFYELVTNWQSGGALQMMGLCKACLVRDGTGWKMKRNEVLSLK